jgi:oxepin-CoA hydrolase/3-oxo-5,6-dehydrosuberyl-CoA semialdehyde dehydrogenase
VITLQSYLRGEWKAGSADGEQTLVNPATEEPIAKVSTKGLDLKGALAWGRETGGAALRAMTFQQRGALLQAMSNALHAAREELIEASIISGGTTRSDAKFDIDGATGTLAAYARIGTALGEKRLMVEGAGEPLTRAPRYCGYHVRSPREGVAVHINAFNFPAWGMCEKAAVAILAGVPVVTKPATSTALLAMRVVEKLVAGAGLPSGALQLVCGSVGDMLDALGPQDVVAFTGSGDTGAMLRKHDVIRARSVRLNVEADSLNAAVLAPDVEVGSDAWHLFIKHTALEITQKAGQKCTATRRILVPRARLDDVQAALVERLAAVRVGNPASSDVDMGPLATRQQLDDAKKGIERLVKSGAQVVFDGAADGRKPSGVPEGKGFFQAPMLLRADKPHDAADVHAHEVFGPVSTLVPYDDVEDAGALVARGEGSLVVSLYGDDPALTEALLLKVAPWSGRVVVGSTKVADQMLSSGAVLPASVHGGPGRAGGGEELGGERGLAFYQQRTAIQGDRAMLDRIFQVKAS